MKKVMLLLCLCLVVSACARKGDNSDNGDAGSEMSAQTPEDIADPKLAYTVYADLKMLDSMAVQVISEETVDNPLDMTAMTDYAILKFKNNCRDIPIVSLDKPLQVGRGTLKIYFMADVVDNKGNILYTLRSVMEMYQIEPMAWVSLAEGYCSKETLENEIKKHIDAIMEEFAKEYYQHKKAK